MIDSSGQRKRQEKNERVQRKEETTMKRTIWVAKQKITKVPLKGGGLNPDMGMGPGMGMGYSPTLAHGGILTQSGLNKKSKE